jgi:hypothetical protein
VPAQTVAISAIMGGSYAEDFGYSGSQHVKLSLIEIQFCNHNGDKM